VPGTSEKKMALNKNSKIRGLETPLKSIRVMVRVIILILSGDSDEPT
jgi:hypothetical protein